MKRLVIGMLVGLAVVTPTTAAAAPRLGLPQAKRAMIALSVRDGAVQQRIGQCHRFGARRIQCSIWEADYLPNASCALGCFDAWSRFGAVLRSGNVKARWIEFLWED